MELKRNQDVIKHLQDKIDHLCFLFDTLKDEKELKLIKKELHSITTLLIKLGGEIKNNGTPEIKVIQFIEVRLDYVGSELMKGTSKKFFYIEDGVLKPLTDYKVFEEEIIKNPYLVKCFEQLEDFEEVEE